MEGRKHWKSVKICRFCLSQDDTLTSIYDPQLNPKKGASLSLKILSCLSVEVFPSDGLPGYICKPCLFFMELFFQYKEMCRKTDESIWMNMQMDSSLAQITWPPLLTKVYRAGSNFGPVNTVVDGTTVQVTSQDGSDSEDVDETNVFSIKIDNESGAGSKHIKLIASNEEKGKTQGKKGKQEDLSYEADSDEEGSPVKDVGCWPCDECHCTFPLQQLLQLHKKMKHRARTVACDSCDLKFFTKSDLATHQLQHTSDWPFQCAACELKFKRLIHLKKHEKAVHAEIPQQACQSCPATFLTMEELELHETKHSRFNISKTSFSCTMCYKKFPDQMRLQRHFDTAHRRSSFNCEYCPAHFNSISKLMKHVRTHAGTRSYPCKYCDKTFIKSHHYTRHLRLKHRTESVSELRKRAPTSTTLTEQYRCEQCSEAFDSQDDLIYHSAIHATQNLTCPLCQEKFEDVDAVTAHIKSHVNGMEFMCDLCELVFTSKEKLDMHLTTAHAEELEQDDSMEAKSDEEDEDESGINVTVENGEMFVEIKKTADFMKQLPEEHNQTVEEENSETALFEENEAKPTYTELATVDTLALVPQPTKAETGIKAEVATNPAAAETATITKVALKPAEPADSQTAHILRKAEEVKRKVRQIAEPVPEKKAKMAKVESSNSVSGASDKSLRLLEKELQELKRTNTRTEATKTPAKPMENLRNRRPQVHTSTPKTRAVEMKKELASKAAAAEKKVIERRIVTKENKEPKDAKDTKATSAKEEKIAREDKKEDAKEKDAPKTVIKNGANEKSQPEENVRRSTRPSKIKDYAKMIRDKSQDSDDDSDDDDAEDEEYKEEEKAEQSTRAKGRRTSIKTATPAPAPAPAPSPPVAAAPPAVRKRGRPRKDAPKEVPAKVRKDDVEEDEEDEKETDKCEAESTSKKFTAPVDKQKQTEDTSTESEPKDTFATKDASKPSTDQKTSPSKLLMSPSGQTLKKVPMRALPPGVKPLPLRPMGAGDVCEMQIGKKVVKVQKIVMTKAEVEAMAKKGLLEMKDGTMVLKQGIKLPTSELTSLVPNLGDKGASKESPKMEKASNSQNNASE